MMNLRLFLEDIREIPTFVLMLSSLRRASNKGRETFAVLLEKQTSRFPERVFLRFEEETVTYEEYNRGANRCAHVLKEAGIKRGDPVAIMMKNSPDFLMAQAAMAKVGSIGALINTHLSGPPLEHVLQVSGARHLLVDQECLPAVVPVTDTTERIIWATGEASTSVRAPASGGSISASPAACSCGGRSSWEHPQTSSFRPR